MSRIRQRGMHRLSIFMLSREQPSRSFRTTQILIFARVTEKTREGFAWKPLRFAKPESCSSKKRTSTRRWMKAACGKRESSIANHYRFIESRRPRETLDSSRSPHFSTTNGKQPKSKSRSDTVPLFRGVLRFARATGAISRERFREESRIVVLGQEVDRRAPSQST